MRSLDTTQQFILIQFSDPEVSCFLNALKETFNERPSKSVPHVTIRGPYSGPPSKKIRLKLEKALENKGGFLISDVGMFDNDGTYVVYLKIDGRDLKEFFWKPSYPKKKFGFTPHVTLYEGTDKEKVKHIYNFLREQKIELFCGSLHLTTHFPNQTDLFSHKPGLQEDFQGKRNIDWNILVRAKQFIARYNVGT